jgi:hypothetical protein
METTLACELQSCAHAATTAYHVSNDRPWVRVCRPHLDLLAEGSRSRASLLYGS